MDRKPRSWPAVLGDLPPSWRRTSLGSLFTNRQERGQGDLPLLAVTSEFGVVPRDTLDRRDTSAADKSRYLK